MYVFAEFGWPCANYVYTPSDIFSSAAHETFKHTAPGRKIRLATSIRLNENPTADDFVQAAADIMKSDCRATVVVTQTAAAAAVVHETHKQGYEGQFLMQGALRAIPSFLRTKLNDDDEVNRMMRGLFTVDSFNGAGTER